MNASSTSKTRLLKPNPTNNKLLTKDNSKSTTTISTLRIIGGSYKRQMISFYAVDHLRPTSDRIRETLFNWLMWEISHKRVIDVCAGSGALGIEALSRGAIFCTFIEPHKKQAEMLRAQLHKLNILPDKYEIMNTTAEAAFNILQANNAQFDVLFLDPPYSLNLWQPLALLYDNLLHQQSLIYVEADIPLEQTGLPHHWQSVKQSKTGRVFYGLYKKH